MKTRKVGEASDGSGILASDEVIPPGGDPRLQFRVIEDVKRGYRLMPAGPELHVTHVDDHEDTRRARDLSELLDGGFFPLSVQGAGAHRPLHAIFRLEED